MDDKELQEIEEALKSSPDSTYDPVTIDEVEMYKGMIRTLLEKVKSMTAPRGEKREYLIPVSWKVWGIQSVEAHSLEEAKELAYDEPLPIGNYMDDSFEIDEDSIPLYNPET